MPDLFDLSMPLCIATEKKGDIRFTKVFL